MKGQKPLRIAMISYYLPSESKIGVGYQVHELANELVRRGHHVDVFSPCAPVVGALYGHIHLPMTGSLRTFRFAFVTRRQDLSSYDVLHAHGEDYWMWRRRVPLHVRTLHGSCFEEAIHIHGLRQKLRMVLLGFTEVLASVVADRTVVISPQTRRWTPWVKTVIPNGVDLARFASSGGSRARRPTVLFVGTWHGRKRGGLLAESFVSDVLPQLPDAELRMVTQDAPSRLPDGVVALGRLSDDELAEEYRRAWVFCLPSSYEGFGIPYAEAMAAGLPVLATPNIGARYVTNEGQFGVLAKPQELGTALVEILESRSWRQSLSQQSLSRVQEFSLLRVADAYESVYRQATPMTQRSGSPQNNVDSRGEPFSADRSAVGDRSAVVVVATYRRPGFVRTCLEHLLAQTAPAARIVVVDASPDDETRLVVSDFDGVEYRRNDLGIGTTATSRAIGSHDATEDVVAFIDDDAYAEPSWLEQLLIAYDDLKVGAVGGRARNGRDGEDDEGLDRIGRLLPNGRLTGNFAANPRRTIKADHMLGANMSARSDVLRAFGGIHDYYPGTCLREETDIAIRVRIAGYEVAYAPDAVVLHVAGDYPKGARFDLRYRFYGARNHILLLTTTLGWFDPHLTRYLLSMIPSTFAEATSGLRTWSGKGSLRARLRGIAGGGIRATVDVVGTIVGLVAALTPHDRARPVYRAAS